MKRAWYTGHAARDLGEAAILVGDPDRVDRIAALMTEVDFLPVKRGLRTITGRYNGKRASVVSFGMGAPIATIVLHEFADLGLKTFVRIGTAMHFPPAMGGDFMISDAAIVNDGTAPAYGVATGSEAKADPALCEALALAAAGAGETVHRGLYATFDAFYRDMFGIDPDGDARANAARARMKEKGVIASDMETSALLAAGMALDVSVATLCYGTVDGITQEKLAPEALESGEQQLFRIALQAITA